jgi:hypothetical protein
MNMKRINGGEFRTLIEIKKPVVKKDKTGFPKRDSKNAENIFGEGVGVPCKWSDKPYNRSYKLSSVIDGAEASREYIYALINYTDKIGYECEIWKSGDDTPYSIINISNVGERNRYTELQLRRVVQTPTK